ncbi:MAG: tRNA adenosine(34) deaminase TadA [Coriobacteriia bacterium]|nr:tRNA adenosine(34) deaminase TadA [Coriobacteriia bacterium]
MNDEHYMRMALEQARQAGDLGEVPIGAVVVVDDEVVAATHNRREVDRDPAGHAEFLALREAARVLDRWRLSDATVYVTLEPCPMCAGLMHQARIARCVYGVADPKAGALGTLYSLHDDARLNHRFEVVGGVLAEECAVLLQGFFAERRAL